MKDLTKYFIDLSKCTEREIISIAFLTQRTVNLHNKAFSYMSQGETLKDFVCLAATDSGEWTLWNKNALFNKTELTYPEFIKLFEGGEDNGWIKVTDSLPNALQTVFISNGKGYTAIGCLVESEGGWHWAESNGVIYEENGEIVSECESYDIEVNFWHPLPEPPKF